MGKQLAEVLGTLEDHNKASVVRDLVKIEKKVLSVSFIQFVLSAGVSGRRGEAPIRMCLQLQQV